MPTDLRRGQIAIIAYATDDSAAPPEATDLLRFVLLAPVTTGTVIYFSNRSWGGASFTAGAGEGTFTWTAGSNLGLGTVVTITKAQLTAAGINLSNTGDTVYAYQGGADAPTSFLFAIDVADGNSTFNGNLTGTGLVAGASAVAVQWDNAAYAGAPTGIAATNLAGMATSARWFGTDTDDIAGTPNYTEVTYTGIESPFFDGHDVTIVAGFAGGGQSEAILRIGEENDANVAANVTRLFRDRADIARIEDMALDLESGYYFVLDTDGVNVNRILRGNIADLANGTSPASFFQIFATDNLDNGVNHGINGELITGIEVDKAANKIYWWDGNLFNEFEGGWEFYSANYDGTGVTLIAKLTNQNVYPGPPFNGSGGLGDWALDIPRGYAYAVNSSSGVDGFGNATVYQNHIIRVNLSTGAITVLALDAADPRSGTNGGVAVDGRLVEAEGQIIALDVDQNTGIVYFITQPVSPSANGGIFRYDPATDDLQELWNQPAPNAYNTLQSFPTANMTHIEVDEIGGRLFVTTLGSLDNENDATPATNEHDASIHVLSLTAPLGTAPTRFVRIYEPTALGSPMGMEIDYDANVAVTGNNATYTESSNGPGSPAGPAVAPYGNTTISDPDTTSLWGATVALTSGFVAGDTLSFTNSGGITGSYDSATGVISFTGLASLAAYQTVLDSVRFTNAGDNPTDYGTKQSRTLSVVVFDGLTYSDLASATLTVVGINDAPVNAVPGAQAFNEDVARVFSTANGNALSVSDVDADPAAQALRVTLAVTQGSLTLASLTGLSFSVGDGSGDATMTFTGTANAINAALGAGLTFTPTADYNGSATLTFTVNDQGSNGSDPGLTGTGTSEQDSDTIALTINAVADIANDSVSTNEDASVNVMVQANDSFENPAHAITTVGPASHGTVSLNDNGTAGNAADDYIVYTPNADYNGADSFTYTVTSGGVTETATVSVTVNAVADIANDSASTAEDNAVDILVLGNDTFEGTPSSLVVGAAGHGVATVNDNGTPGNFADDYIVYTPTADYNGADSFTYTVTSGGVAETGTVNVTVSAVADIVADSFNVGIGSASNILAVMANDSFENPAAAIQLLPVAPLHGTATAVDGPDAGGILDHVNYVPAAGYSGTDSFTYTVLSGGVTESVTVNLVVQSLTLGGTVFLDANGDGSSTGDSGINFVSTTLYRDNGTLAGQWDASDSLVAGTNTAAGGQYSFSGLAAGDYVVVIGAGNFAAGQPLEGLMPSPANIDVNDDVDGDSNGVAAAGGAIASYAVHLSYQGEVTPDPSQANQLNINNTVDFGFVSNQPPVFGAGTITGSATELPDGDANENTQIDTATGSIAFTDADTTDIHSSSVTPGGGGYLGTFGTTVTEAFGSGNVNWTFTVDDNALDVLREGQIVTQTYNVTVNDGNGGTDTEVVTITLNGKNDAVILNTPAVGVITDTAANDSFADLSGAFAFADPDIGDTHTFSIVGGSADLSQAGFDLSKSSSYGTLYLNGSTGAYKFVVNDAAVEGLVLEDQASFGITISDGFGSDTKIYTINIEGSNDNPDMAAAGPFAEVDTPADDSFPDFTGALSATDRDIGDSATFSITGGAASADPGFTYQKVGTYGTLFVNTTSGAYKFVANDTAIEAVKTNQSESFQLVAADTHGGTSAQTLTINVSGANDAPQLSAVMSASYIDTAGDDSFADYNGTLVSSDRDNPETATYSLVGGVASGLAGFDQQVATAHGTAYVNATTGAYRFLPSDAAIEALKTMATDSVSFVVTDGSGATSTQQFDIVINGAEDAPDLTFGPGDSIGVGIAEGNAGLSHDGTATPLDRDMDPVTASITAFSKSGTTTGLVPNDAALQAMMTLTPVGAFAPGANTLGWHFNSGGEAFNYLAQGESLSLIYTIKVNDGTLDSNSQNLLITINGTNDGPLLSAIAPIAYADTAANDSFSAVDGILAFTDPDVSDTHVFSITGAGADLSLAGFDQSLASAYGRLYLNSASGAYRFVPDDAGIEAIKANTSIDFALNIVDNHSGVDSKLLTVNLTGTNDTPVLNAIPAISFADTSADDNFAVHGGFFGGSDRDNPETLTYSIAGSVADGSHVGYDRSVATAQGNLYFNSATGAFAFIPDDAAIEALKTTVDINFAVVVTDASAATASQTLNVHIVGANDIPDASIQGGDSGGATLTETNAGLSANGTLSVADRDVPETVTAATLSVVKSGIVTGLVPSDAALMAMFTGPAGPVPAGPGATNNLAWSFNSGGEAFDYLDDGESLTLTYGIQVTDSSGASDIQNVTITINGTNDAPVITIAGSDTIAASLDETNAGLVQSGTLTIVDPDQSDVVVPAVIGFSKSGVTAGLVPSDAVLQAMLLLPGSVAADPGSAHNLTWTFDSGSEAFDYLHTGEVLTLSYTLQLADDNGVAATQLVTVTITGTNDAPVILPSTVAQGSVTELPDHDPNENVATLTTSGAVDFSDNEVADTHIATALPQAGGYIGSFTMSLVENNGLGSAGWSFSVSDAALNALGDAVVLKQYYDVTIDDGHGGTVTQTVEVDLHGTNDAAILTSANVIVPQGPAPVSASGDLDITDEDDPALFVVQSNTAGHYGHFSIDADGNWSYLADAAYILGPNEVLSEVFTVLAVDGTPTTVAVTIQGIDQPGAAHDDLFTTNESSVIGAGRNLFADNGSGPDSDPDTPLVIGAVNGNPANVGHSLLLASGARVIVNSNGTFSYDTNGAWTGLSGLMGASNHFGHDSFTYTLAGGDTATVYMNIVGEVTPGDVSYGSGGDDNILGSSANDTIRLDQSGHDHATGEGGNDGFYFGSTLDTLDSVDGGTGNDTVALQGNTNVVLGDISNVEVIALLSGSNAAYGDTGNNRYDYSLTTNEGNVGAGQTLTVIGTALLPGEDLHFDGSAETNGNFRIFAGQGVDDLTGGSGNDGFFFGADGNLTGADHVNGGAGTDSIALRGNYVGANAVVFQDGSFSNVEVLAMLSGHSNEYGGVIVPGGYDYDVTMANGNVAGGRTFDVSATGLKADESLRFDGRLETDAFFRIFSGAGNDTLYGGGQNDMLYGAMGKDWMEGGAGADTYIFRSAAESTGIGYDTISGFDYSADRIDAPGGGSRSFSQSATGNLSLGSFDADLASGLSGVLGAGQAALFTASGGSLSGHVFAVIDANGVAGYQAGEDLVIELLNPVLPIDPHAGVIV